MVCKCVGTLSQAELKCPGWPFPLVRFCDRLHPSLAAFGVRRISATAIANSLQHSAYGW